MEKCLFLFYFEPSSQLTQSWHIDNKIQLFHSKKKQASDFFKMIYLFKNEVTFFFLSWL